MTTKKQRMVEFYARAAHYGVSFGDVEALRRIEMTLHRWAEHECNGNIQRDEETNKPFWHFESSNNRYPYPDKEAGALKRLAGIMERYPQFKAYHQSDPRGCALYLVPVKDLEGGKDISAYYSQGFAICY